MQLVPYPSIPCRRSEKILPSLAAVVTAAVVVATAFPRTLILLLLRLAAAPVVVEVVSVETISISMALPLPIPRNHLEDWSS
jgi:hypothetical protein